jgi:hypothetical protein
MIFIPLQMGFSIPFTGWILFMEIMTLIFYTMDLVVIIRRYKRLVNLSRSLPINSSDYKDKLLRDSEEVEKRIMHYRLNILTSIIGVLPLSLIL